MYRLPRELWIFALSLLLFSLGMGMYAFLLPLYAGELGASPAQLGLIYTIGMAIGTFASLPGGWLADRCDRKWILVLSWAVCIPVPLIFIIAKTWIGLIPGIILFYLSFFGNAAINAYVVSRSDPGRTASTFTLIFASFPLGLIFAPTLGGWLAENYGFTSVFIVSFIFYSLSTIVMSLIPSDPPAKPATATYKFFTFTPGVLRFCLLCSLAQASLAMALPFINPWLQDFGGYQLSGLGLLGTVSAVAAVILSPLLGRLADHSGRLTYLIGLTFTAIGLLLLIPNQLPILIILHFVLRSCFDGIRGQMSAQLGRMVDSSSLGQSYALFGVINGVFGTIAPWMGGVIYSVLPQATFFTSAILMLAVMIPFVGMDKTADSPRLVSHL